MRTHFNCTTLLRIITLCLFVGSGTVFLSCSEDEFSEAMATSGEEDNDAGNSEDEGNADSSPANECPGDIGFVFEEANGIVSIEFEDNDFPQGWVLKNDGEATSGDGYMQWEGDPKMNAPGNGTVVFPFRITQPGTYRFLWKSSFRAGNDGTEHNDSWLRFPDADDFFGRKGDGSVIYPKDSGKTPNPNGSSSDGWFKIYRSGNDTTFKWQASTSDHDAHDIYASFSSSGVYRIEISARSTFHGIDRLLLFQEGLSQNDAIQAADTFSLKTNCD